MTAFLTPKTCKRKVEASALFIVIVIALVIGLICSSLILVAYNYKCRISDNINWKRLEDNLNSSIHLLLSDSELVEFHTAKLVDLYEEETDSVLIKKIHWGVFEVGAVKSFSKRFSLEKTFIYGYRHDDTLKSAIYLADEGRPLSITGNTFIKGNCFLPEAGIKTPPMDGSYFQDDKPIKGNVKKSKSKLPKANQAVLDRLKEYLEGKFMTSESVDIVNSIEADTIRRSFFENTLIIKLKKKTRLSKVFLSGNIILTSDTALVIDASAKLNDVLIFAPGVELLEGFTGSLQIVAKDSVVVNKSCNLNYPSAICLLKTDFKTTTPFIKLKSESKLSGLIFTYSDVEDTEYTEITLEKDVVVEGLVFCDGSIEHQGKVYGNVTCKEFTIMVNGNNYVNFLFNATIDNSKLSRHYIGSSLLYSHKRKAIIKYLD